MWRALAIVCALTASASAASSKCGVSFNCYGDPAVCDPLLATASIDTSELVEVASLGSGGKSMAYRIGALVGSAVLALAIVGAFWNRRRKTPPPI